MNKKTKFNPQKGILVAGLVAGTYAEACFNNPPTQAICFFSGDTVDTIGWNLNNSPQNVIATADWTHGHQTAGVGTLHAYVTASPGFTTATTDRPTYCYGPAKFKDNAGNTDTVPYWENGVAGGQQVSVPTNPKNNQNATWGELGNTTCQ